jgi:transposase
MDYHHHARLTCYGREGLSKSVVEGWLSLREAAAERGLSRQSAGKWVKRYREAGAAGLGDRSSRPRSSPRSTAAVLVERVEQLRRERWTGVRIAQASGLSRATVSRILVRLKLNKVKMLEPKIPVIRYERDTPGDLLHIDIKKLARIKKPGHRITGNPRDETRGAGWEFLYVAVDDHSRMAYVAMMPDEKAVSASSFLRQAHAYFARHNIQMRGVMTDNGPCFISDMFRDTNRSLQLKHIRQSKARVVIPARFWAGISVFVVGRGDAGDLNTILSPLKGIFYRSINLESVLYAGINWLKSFRRDILRPKYPNEDSSPDRLQISTSRVNRNIQRC